MALTAAQSKQVRDLVATFPAYTLNTHPTFMRVTRGTKHVEVAVLSEVGWTSQDLQAALDVGDEPRDADVGREVAKAGDV